MPTLVLINLSLGYQRPALLAYLPPPRRPRGRPTDAQRAEYARALAAIQAAVRPLPTPAPRLYTYFMFADHNYTTASATNT